MWQEKKASIWNICLRIGFMFFSWQVIVWTSCFIRNQLLYTKPDQRETRWDGSQWRQLNQPSESAVCWSLSNSTSCAYALTRAIWIKPSVESITKCPQWRKSRPGSSQAKKLTVEEAKEGFLQKRLDIASSYKTTFKTPFGRYRWNRMPFGICSAPEV